MISIERRISELEKAVNSKGRNGLLVLQVPYGADEKQIEMMVQRHYDEHPNDQASGRNIVILVTNYSSRD